MIVTREFSQTREGRAAIAAASMIVLALQVVLAQVRRRVRLAASAAVVLALTMPGAASAAFEFKDGQWVDDDPNHGASPLPHTGSLKELLIIVLGIPALLVLLLLIVNRSR
jgi:LPXTG-motif cell wall-anchored protein